MIFLTSFIKCRLQYKNTKCPIKVSVWYFQIAEYFTWKHQIYQAMTHMLFLFHESRKLYSQQSIRKMLFSTNQNLAIICFKIQIAGTPQYSGVCDAVQMLYDLCTLISILLTLLHWILRVRTSRHYIVVVSEQ